jgi:hypothetical protein
MQEPPDLFSDEGTLTPDPHNTDESPEHVNVRGGQYNKGMSVEKMKTLRLHRKDFKKGGEALRGKNVTEGYRYLTVGSQSYINLKKLR